MTAASTPQTPDEALALVRRCDPLPFPSRARTLALAARALPPDVFGSLHTLLDTGGHIDRRTGLHLAVPRRDVKRVENALRDPDLWRAAMPAVRRCGTRR